MATSHGRLCNCQNSSARRSAESVHPYVGAWWPPGHIIGYEHTFVHAIHDFLVALENDTLPSPNFTDGVKNQAVLEAIERSAKSGKWEKP